MPRGITTPLETRYFAVPDPTTGDMTYWRRDANGLLGAWPTRPQAYYGPRTYERRPSVVGPHGHVVPAGLTGLERNEWMLRWYGTVWRPWHKAIEDAIASHPEVAMARFWAVHDRCAICGRKAADAEGGIGPGCRRRVPEDLVSAVARELALMYLRGEPVATTEPSVELRELWPRASS